MEKELEGKIGFLLVTLAAVLVFINAHVLTVQHTIIGIILMGLLSWSKERYSPPTALHGSVWALCSVLIVGTLFDWLAFRIFTNPTPVPISKFVTQFSDSGLLFTNSYRDVTLFAVWGLFVMLKVVDPFGQPTPENSSVEEVG